MIKLFCPSRSIQMLYFFVCIFGLAAIISGCAPSAQRQRIVWPVPPATPKIEFLGVFATENDFRKTEAEKMAASLLGVQPAESFLWPAGIASDGEGRVYVSDLHLKNIKVFDFNQRKVSFYHKEPMFRRPVGLDMDDAKNLYVVDGDARAVRVFDKNRKLLRSYTNLKFQNPAYVELDEELNRIYVSDGNANLVFVLDLGSGELIHVLGDPDITDPDKRFFAPQGMAVSTSHEIYVADRFHSRVVVYDKDFNYLRAFGSLGDQAYQFEAPKDLAFDSVGNLYIIDQRRGAIYTYSPDGRLLLETGTTKVSAHPLSFGLATAIFIDKKDQIFITDSLSKRFAFWQYLNEQYLAEHPLKADDLESLKSLGQKALKEMEKSK